MVWNTAPDWTALEKSAFHVTYLSWRRPPTILVSGVDLHKPVWINVFLRESRISAEVASRCLQDKQHLYSTPAPPKKKKEINIKRDPATCLHDGWVKFERRGFNMPFDDESLLSSSLFLACSSLKEETASEEICEDLPWKTDGGWWALQYGGEDGRGWERCTCLCNGNEKKFNSIFFYYYFNFLQTLT